MFTDFHKVAAAAKAKPLRMRGHALITCNAGCAQSLRADSRCGLIYGPFTDGTRDRFGRYTMLSRAQATAHSGACLYCGATLPKGRAARIAATLASLARKRA